MATVVHMSSVWLLVIYEFPKQAYNYECSSQFLLQTMVYVIAMCVCQTVCNPNAWAK